MTRTAFQPPSAAYFHDGNDAPEMVAVPPGEFWMGATEDDKFASALERPRRRVRIDGRFAIGRIPVTFGQWDAFAADAGPVHRPDDRGWGRGPVPVLNVSWDDAQAYVRWLSCNTGRPYRLPSEAEWEYCCRGGTDGIFSTGSRLTFDEANFLRLDFGGAGGAGRPVPAGSYPPNPFGLYDMHGNVCELVADVWHDTYEDAPPDGVARSDPEASPWRVVRGGGWDGLPRVLRAAFRDWVRRDQRLDNTGFRVACDLT